MPPAVCRTRTVPSSPPLMMTGVRSGSAPPATAYTSPGRGISGPLMWAVISAVRSARTVLRL
jgi:hypothetical protein